MSVDLKTLFGRFAGREIEVREVYDETTGKTLFAEPLKSPDPLLEDMKQTAQANGLTLRLRFPGASVEKDRLGLTRVNARAEKGGDGCWRIGADFWLG